MIEVLEQGRTFHLCTDSQSMILHAMDSGHAVCLYWGKRVYGTDFSYLINELETASYLAWTDGERAFRLEQYPLLYPVFGYPDLRTPALHLRYEDGSRITDLRYSGYEIRRGKQKIPGLPVVIEREAGDGQGDGEVLELCLADSEIGIEVRLVFTVFAEYDAVTQSVMLLNSSGQSVYAEKIMSACFSFLTDRFDCMTLTGAWAREFHRSRQPVRQGTFQIGSSRGAGGHGQNPFLALTSPDCTEDHGEVWGLNLVYSGSFEASIEVDMHQNTRIMMGIQSFDFSWQLKPGEVFYTPEAVLVYSGRGLNGMSQTFHRLYRERLMPSEWARSPRPIVINNWEATYFDFNRENLLALGKAAAEIGIEMFVLDDGWFGQRDSDSTSLGDWTENTAKLGGSLGQLGADMKKLGLDFGIWMEPEMVSPDSDLFRIHPDWVIASPSHKPQLARGQYVLDLSRECVRRYVTDAVAGILEKGNVSYVKWDMNRNLTDCYSWGLAPDQQKELPHRYILGLYEILEELTARFPQVLFEACAGGGGRYDPGMLYYMPQVWASDDTDAVERLEIQAGVSMVYPAVSMSCHVSAVPNHQVGRCTSVRTRGITAMQGVLGYELDLLKCQTAEKKELAEQIQCYKELRDLIQRGTFLRLRAENGQYAWMYVSEDKRKILISWARVLAAPNTVPKRLRLQGLEVQARYRLAGKDIVRTGSQWMECGIALPRADQDYCAAQWRLHRVD